MNHSVFAVVMVSFTSGALIILDSFRGRIAILFLQYAGFAWLVSLSLPLEIALVKLVTGMLLCGIAILSWKDHSVMTTEAGEYSRLPPGKLFRFLSVLLVLVASVGLIRMDWIPLPDIPDAAAWGATILFMMGLLQLGLSSRVFRMGVGMLTMLSGFEVIYAVIEPSLAVMALLAAVHLGIVVVTSYLMIDTGRIISRGSS